MSIPFTQYLLPDGRKHLTSIALDNHIERMAHALIDKGYKFECEVLRNGIVSLTVASPIEDEGDIAVKLSRNGPEMMRSVTELVEQVYNERVRDTQ